MPELRPLNTPDQEWHMQLIVQGYSEEKKE